MLTALIPLVIFILILSILVFIHELGHFLSARSFDIEVEEFGLGLPPRAIGKKWGETLYSLNWLPLGGFVKIKGEDFEDYKPGDSRNFLNKHPWKQAVVLVAGVVMNLILAVALFYFVLGANGWRANPLLLITDYNFRYGNTEILDNIIVFMPEDSPALEGGLEFADRIVSFVYQDQYVEVESIDQIKEFINGKEGEEILVTTVNLNTEKVAQHIVIPEYNEDIGQAAIGVQLDKAVQLTYDEGSQPLFSGFSHAANITGYSAATLGSLISTSFKEQSIQPVSAGVSGPIGIFGAVRAIFKSGGPNLFMIMVDLTAILSLSLAIMNLLPIPALDGGRLVFVVMEWVTGKRPSRELEGRAHQIGFAFLLGLIAIVTLKDIFQLF